MGKAGSPLQPLSSGVVHIHAHAHTHLTLACTTSPPQHGEKARFLPPGLLLQTLGKPTKASGYPGTAPVPDPFPQQWTGVSSQDSRYPTLGPSSYGQNIMVGGAQTQKGAK